ncbi:DUF4376 domain-containing protein [Bombella favorum]|uniref:DUF4376 domain-containing protein n=1 Tax=Bombella favorum TaxID=2039164 RepID=A0ABR5ZME0_9PROT|nr:DUF4376 domain-containing protein [Bombella favorum]MBA5725491.1 hypothetical protein [Bombella favorum]
MTDENNTVEMAATSAKSPDQIAYPDRYYAQYDPKGAQPAPVIAWWDMWGRSSLDGLPSLSDLLPMTADQWNQHISQPQASQAVQNGKIVPYTPPKTLAGQQGILVSLTAQKKALGVYFQPTYASAPVLFPSDDTAYANALQQAQVAQLGAWTDGTAWTLADGSSVPMTSDDVTALFKKLAKYRGACQTHAAALNATLQHDLNADLTAGWPDNH